jgi:hypothetical protein
VTDEEKMRMAEFARRAHAFEAEMETAWLGMMAEHQADGEAVDVANSINVAAQGEATVTAVLQVDAHTLDALLGAWTEATNRGHPHAFRFLMDELVKPVINCLLDEAAKEGWYDISGP